MLAFGLALHDRDVKLSEGHNLVTRIEDLVNEDANDEPSPLFVDDEPEIQLNDQLPDANDSTANAPPVYQSGPKEQAPTSEGGQSLPVAEEEEVSCPADFPGNHEACVTCCERLPFRRRQQRCIAKCDPANVSAQTRSPKMYDESRSHVAKKKASKFQSSPIQARGYYMRGSPPTKKVKRQPQRHYFNQDSSLMSYVPREKAL